MPAIDVKALRYFIAVAQFANYSRAAQHLRLTQPAISRQIHDLELALSVQLFVREGRRLILTESGSALLRESRRILAAVDDLPGMVGASANTPQGRLAFGVTPAASEYLIPKILKDYHRRFDAVQVSIVQDHSRGLIERLRSEQIDLAIVYGDHADSAIALEPILELPLGVICSPLEPSQAKVGKTVSLAEAARFPLVVQGRQHGLRRLLEAACASIGVELNVLVETDSLPLAKAIVRTGFGWTVNAHPGVVEEVNRGELRFIPIRNPSLQWSMSIAARRSSPRSLAQIEMEKEIKKAVIAAVREDFWHGRVLIADGEATARPPRTPRSAASAARARPPPAAPPPLSRARRR